LNEKHKKLKRKKNSAHILYKYITMLNIIKDVRSAIFSSVALKHARLLAYKIISLILVLKCGAHGCVVAKGLGYKPEGRVFETR
jgi:hypothetical protein